MIRDLGLTRECAPPRAEQKHHVHLLGQVDVFVLPSRYEGMSNALLEAMAAGLPCVATEVSGNEENIEPERSGLLVPPNQPEALAEALATMLTQREYARRLGCGARDRVVAHFDRNPLLLRLVNLYASRWAGGHFRIP